MIKNKLPLELKLFVLFNLYYFISLVFAEVEEYLNIVYLMLLGLFAIRNIHYLKYFGKFLIRYFSIIILLLFIGVYNLNYSSYIFYDLICFGSILICFNKIYFTRPKDFYILLWPKCAYIISLFSIISLIIYIIVFGYSVASIENGRGLDDMIGKIMSPKYFVAASIFIYPLKFYFTNKWINAIFKMNIMAYIFFSLAMGSRGTTLIAIFIFSIANYFDPYATSSFEVKKLISKKAILSFFSIIIIILMLYNIDQVRNAIDYLVFRFNNENLGEDRFNEAQYVYNSLSVVELLIGRGLGAANGYWPSDNPYGVNIVHYGWMFLILKGGIFFLVFIYSNIIIALFKLYKVPEFRPYSLALISFILLETSHTNFSSFLNMSFVFIAFAASIIQRK